MWTLALGKQDNLVPFSGSEGKAGFSVRVFVRKLFVEFSPVSFLALKIHVFSQSDSVFFPLDVFNLIAVSVSC